MSTYIWSVRIFAGDHAAQVTETVTAGLYNVQSDLSGNAAADQKVVNVDDGTLFQRADDATLPKCPKVLIQDDSHSEEAVIVSISGNALTMRDNLTNAYTTAAHAKVIADSEFRWIQNAVPSLSETWRDDMLVPGGIGKIIHLLDLSDGGNTATVNGLEVTIKNVDLFWNTLFSTLDLSLIGARAEIVLFTDTTETVKWYGICEKPKWDRRTYTIPMRGTWKKRSVNITTEQNVEGKDEKIVIPATFGEWKDAPAMLVRTVSSETTQSLFGILYDMVSVYGAAIANFVNLEIVGRKIFPIVAAGASPSLTYDIQFGTAAEIDFLDFGTLDFSDLDLFLYICEDESAQGVYRHIESIDYKSGTAITITVSCYYKTDPTASAGATEAWVKIINLAREYESDVWPHKAFIDEQGAEITAGINLYTYSDDSRVTISGDPSTAPITSPVEKRQIGFYLLPSYAYEIESGDTDYNRLIINPELVESNIDKISSFIIKPVINPRLLNLSTADARSVWGFGSTITKINAGLYGTIPNDLTITTDSGAFADTI
ncbi:MAG: hypothetical protein KKD77_22230, partial [Gammaproteobacteria bacterium]|nr:hypothetical protein [Gammaproteobacteria bacterium]